MMKPVVFPKYDIGIVVKNCNLSLLVELEPWCNNVYTDLNAEEIRKYIEAEQPHTQIDLKKKILYVLTKKMKKMIVFLRYPLFLKEIEKIMI